MGIGTWNVCKAVCLEMAKPEKGEVMTSMLLFVWGGMYYEVVSLNSILLRGKYGVEMDYIWEISNDRCLNMGKCRRNRNAGN